MIQGDTFQSVRKPINKVDTILHDPFLSEFKYHFIVKKLPIYQYLNDKIKWIELTNNLYKGFNAPFMGHNSIHVIQILNVYPEMGQVDLIVGFRRDQHAMKVYRQNCSFEFQNQMFQVQVAEGFKTYLDHLNEQYRMQTAQRQKLKAIQNQSILKIQENDLNNRSPILQQTKIIGKSSNLTIYREEQQKQNLQSQKQQGQIFDSQGKSQRRKNSSHSSYSSKSSKQYQQKTKNMADKKQFDANLNPYNRQGLYIETRSNKKKNSSQYKSSQSYSERSNSSSSLSYRKSYGNRDRDRSSRDRQRKNQMKRSSSFNSSYSSDSGKHRQSYRHRNESKYNRNYTQNVRKYDNPRPYRNIEERRQDQNYKYQIPSSFNRVYSYNNRNYSQQQTIPSQMSRKYSQEQYYRPQISRNQTYQADSKPSQSYYYKHTQDYSYNRQNTTINEEAPKSGYRNNSNRNNQSFYRGQN